ncbi:hypothetical protein YC2023_098684 [Brassica napus]|uniref:ATP-dependent DNA helicase n=1 Tax=Brassica oleracea TaxID=3712 RepID=A0A3P6F9M7_BRAOL|nr:unnamed protein product [Brassica oleracea]
MVCQKARGRQYDLPSASKIGGLIVGDLSATSVGRDIVVELKSSTLQRISDLHPLMMSLQYPLLFPYGEPGYSERLPYEGPEASRVRREYMTMREFYACQIQTRPTEGMTIIKGRRLLHQYIVDAYIATEQERLRNICDAVEMGDADETQLGNKIILPSSFTAGPRYMAEKYQDAMAICRCYGNPHLFITVTANPNWVELNQHLDAYGGESANSRPDLVCRLFKLKLDEMVSDFKKGVFFPKTTAGKRISQVYLSTPLSFKNEDCLMPTFYYGWKLKQYTLIELEQLLKENDQSLADYPDIPLPNNAILTEISNTVLRQELSYDIQQETESHQRTVYDAVLESVESQSGQLFFVYGPGGTGKTYLYRTLIAKLRSTSKVVIPVASSGFGALLLPGGRTAHSRFKLPLTMSDVSMCTIHRSSMLATLIAKTDLIIWKVFTHGQLYVALSRVTSPEGLKILDDSSDSDEPATSPPQRDLTINIKRETTNQTDISIKIRCLTSPLGYLNDTTTDIMQHMLTYHDININSAASIVEATNNHVNGIVSRLTDYQGTNIHIVMNITDYNPRYIHRIDVDLATINQEAAIRAPTNDEEDELCTLCFEKLGERFLSTHWNATMYSITNA